MSAGSGSSETSATSATSTAYAVVIPSLGRTGLAVVLEGLVEQEGPAPVEVVVVDDRAHPTGPLDLPASAQALAVRVVRGYGHGPAAARNLGWRVTTAPWICFLDDDVELPRDWTARLCDDLAGAAETVGGVQGRILVPRPAARRPTDWERSTAGLETARWATADMAYRRTALTAVHGFDERFPRAYREDADLALRVQRAGWDLARGDRTIRHPVRPEDALVSVRAQRGNADDALMRRLHGPGWRDDAATGRGRLRWHAATTGLLVLAVVTGAAAGISRLRPGRQPQRSRSAAAADTACLSALGWLVLTADFTYRRVRPGPRDPREWARMTATSVLIPPLAVWHRARGWWQHRGREPWPPSPRAVLFDRDGTLVHDVPDNTHPDAVEPCAGAREGLHRLRRAGLATGVVSNQAGVAEGRISRADLARVNAAVEARLGPFSTWQVCVHTESDACSCRKPRPGLVQAAARELGIPTQACVVVGDIGADVVAARAAGARGVLVPTAVTRPEEVEDAPWVARDLTQAVDLVMGWRHE